MGRISKLPTLLLVVMVLTSSRAIAGIQIEVSAGAGALVPFGDLSVDPAEELSGLGAGTGFHVSAAAAMVLGDAGAVRIGCSYDRPKGYESNEVDSSLRFSYRTITLSVLGKLNLTAAGCSPRPYLVGGPAICFNMVAFELPVLLNLLLLEAGSRILDIRGYHEP